MIISKLKELFKCKSSRELATKLQVNESTISRWQKKGFSRSITRLITLLLEKIKCQNPNSTEKQKKD